MGDWIVNEGPKWLFLPSLGVARASAACLNFNCMLILLPVCRNLVSYLRGSCGFCRRSIRRQLDKNISFHKAVAYMVCLHTALHVGAHFFNFDGFMKAYYSEEESLASRLSSLPTSEGGTWLNPIRGVDGSVPFGLGLVEICFTKVAGWTGAIITIVLIILVTSSTETIRRSYFEVFWFTHHLFIVFFACLLFHGIEGIVRSQTNTDEHNPYECHDKDWGPDQECPEPQFAGSSPTTWIWLLIPMILYGIERCIRLVRSFQKVTITKVIKHPSSVIELQLQKKGFNMLPGQYVFIQCPKISRLEWHPFTLTSAPEEETFSVHIRLVGDWTQALSKVCKADEIEFQVASKMPSLGIDGPFGTSSTDIFRYSVGVCVAAGIGATPFASVLKSIWYKYNNPNDDLKLQKVYFYWICPDTNAFEWFADLLQHLEQQMLELGNRNFLDYNIFLTRGWDANQARNIYLHEGDDADVVTGLQQKTHYGRPQWDQIFPGIADAHPGTNIGVFFCGPKSLSTVLHKKCNEYSTIKQDGTRFHYNKENF
ncbi:cytochrome b-245 heavy chain-like isoform X2 [Ptychodera flava]|uniref:cytochrome b-245 heavy chain-like isoform X2 n=1 Tax=Ptychodera flava TaxID=63121 RepID=UPI003969FFA4